MTRKSITGIVIGFAKYFVAFIVALIVPVLLVNQIGTTAALILMIITLYLAAQYGKRAVYG
ncbi:hypothetical protein DMJ13_25980 [halophilic archaeon]|nr:hypothetical protein DMJ13_25980 [halophilic archaeon]